MTKRDSNSDRQSWNREHWPLDHHQHGLSSLDCSTIKLFLARLKQTCLNSYKNYIWHDGKVLSGIASWSNYFWHDWKVLDLLFVSKTIFGTIETDYFFTELPIQLSAHVGAVLDDTPIICGGFSDYRPQEQCFQFEFGDWYRVSSEKLWKIIICFIDKINICQLQPINSFRQVYALIARGRMVQLTQTLPPALLWGKIILVDFYLTLNQAGSWRYKTFFGGNLENLDFPLSQNSNNMSFYKQ